VEPPKGLYRRNYRKYQRYPFLIAVKLVDSETKDHTVAYAFNVSYGGLGMYTQKSISEKSHVDVWISFHEADGKSREERVGGIVRWVRQLNDLHAFGIEFEELNVKDHPLILNFVQEAERLSP
jgi:hypothetical protein